MLPSLKRTDPSKGLQRAPLRSQHRPYQQRQVEKNTGREELVATTCELGRPRTTPPQGPPAEATDGTEAWCSTDARPNVLWVTRSTSIRGSEVGRALGRGHDLSRRLRPTVIHTA